MARPRTDLLRNLADYTLPIEPTLGELREYGWDATTPLFTITRQHVLGVLARYLSGELTSEQVTDWADLVECRDDLDYEHGFENQIKRAVFELANPNLTQAVTPKLANGLQKRLS